MTDKLTSEKSSVIDRAQEIAEEKLRGDSRVTKVTLWDDDDFKVEVIHGYGEFREKILWRSSGSEVYPSQEFLYIVDTIHCSEEGSIVKMEECELE